VTSGVPTASHITCCDNDNECLLQRDKFNEKRKQEMTRDEVRPDIACVEIVCGVSRSVTEERGFSNIFKTPPESPAVLLG